MAVDAPRRGSLVAYAGCSLFFEPNGTSCFLYARAEDVGHRHRAVFTPRLTAVAVTADTTRVPTTLQPKQPSPRELAFLAARRDLLLGHSSSSDEDDDA